MNEFIFDVQRFVNTNNTVDGALVTGTTVDDNITNRGNNVTINGGAGNDIVENWGDNVLITVGDGKDSVYSRGAKITIDGGADDDTLSSYGNDSSIEGGAGDDNITGGGSNLTISGGADNDTVTFGGSSDSIYSNVLVEDSVGNNYFHAGYVKDSTIIGGSGNDSAQSSNVENVLINLGAGNNSVVSNYDKNITIQALGGNDTINLYDGNNIAVDVGDGANIISVANINDSNAAKYTITSGKDADSIGIDANDALINVGEGNNTIISGGQLGGNNVTINSGAGNDFINNYYDSEHAKASRQENVLINAGAGNDTITNNGNKTTINGGDGNDDIQSYDGENFVINGDGGSDTIFGAKGILNGGADADSISGNNATINGGAGNDTIRAGENVIVQYSSGDGNDLIEAFSANSTLSIGGGSYTSVQNNDSVIVNVGDGQITLAGAANLDTLNIVGTYSGDSSEGKNITNNLDNVLLSGTNKADTIDNSGNNVTIQTFSGNDYISGAVKSNSNITIDSGDGNDEITTYGTNVSVNGGAGNDSIKISADSEKVTVLAGEDDDTIFSTAINSFIDGGNGKDFIHNDSSNVTIDGGLEDDLIENYGSNVSISGGAGADLIKSANSYEGVVTVNGGIGDDTVSISSGSYSIEYNVGDGKDVIIGFNDNDTLNITSGTYSTVASGNDLVITVGEEEIKLVDAATISALNINGTQKISLAINNTVDGATLTGTSDDDTITNSGSNVTINALGGKDTITNSNNNKTYVDAGEGDDFILNSLRYELVSHEGSTVKTLQNYYSDTTIVAGSGNDTVDIIGGYNVSVVAGEGNDYVFSHHSYYKTVDGGAGDDLIEITEGHYENIFGGDGNDTIVGKVIFETLQGDWAMGGYANIDGGAGADYVSVGYSNNATINVGAGDDTVITYGSKSTINGGDGNDSIVLISNSDSTLNSNGTTITGGAGNDTITLDDSNIVLNYTKGDGNDVIVGFTADDTLRIEKSGHTTVKSGNDLIVSTSDGNITLSGAATLESLKIDNAYESSADAFVKALQQKVEGAGYPLIAGLLFHPEEYHGFENLPSDYYASSDTLTINSSDGLTLTGFHYTPANPNDKWALIVHGYGHNHKHMNAFTMSYLANNYNVLVIDQRAAGDSQGEWLTMGSAEGNDVALWTHKIAELNPKAKITLHGVSMGAATVMLAAANSNLTNVTSLVEDCGYTAVMNLVDLAKGIYSDLEDPEFINVLDSVDEKLTGYKLSAAAPIDSIASAKMPTMFITGTSDSVVPPSMLETLYAASGAEVKEIFTVAGATHGLSALADSIGYGNAVFRFNAEADGEGWVTSNVTNNISLRGTKYDDTITSSGSGVTINTGAGNDTIINSGSGNTYVYTLGDGNDVIVGFTASDTLIVSSDTYTTSVNSDDKIISLTNSKNTITLKGAANININVDVQNAYMDKSGNQIKNPVATIVIDGKTYYYESVAKASEDAESSSTITVIANSTETATINTTKNLAVQFAESGLGVYNALSGNFLSNGKIDNAAFSIALGKILSNNSVNNLQIASGSIATLDGYEIQGTSNGYTFTLQNEPFTFNGASYYGAGTATFDTNSKVTLTSGAIVNDSSLTTSQTGIVLAAGIYTLNGDTLSTTATHTVYLDDGGVHFNVSSDTVAYKSFEFKGEGAASIKGELPTLTAGVEVTRPERAMVVLTEKGQNTIDGRGFQMVENISEGITVGAVDNGIGAAHIIPYESFPEDAGKLFAEEALIYGDDNYTLRLNKDGIQSIYGISNGSTVRGKAYFQGEVDPLGSVLQMAVDGAGNYTFGNKTYTINGSIDSSNPVALTSRFYNDDSAALKSIYYLNGEIIGDFSSAVTINQANMPVQVLGDESINVYATDSVKASDDANKNKVSSSGNATLITGLNNGATVVSAGGATKVSTEEEGTFTFRSNDAPQQSFTISGDNSVDFILRNYTDANGNPTMQVEGVNNFENGTYTINSDTSYHAINVGDTINAKDELDMFFSDKATFTIADSKVVSVEGIDNKINNLTGNVNVHAATDITVNNVYFNVKGDNDYNVIISDGSPKNISNISSGASVSVANILATTDNNGDFTFATDTYTINDNNGSVTFATDKKGAVTNIADFSGTLKSSAQNVTVNGLALNTSNTDVSIVSSGTGISEVNGLASGDSIKGALDTTTVIMPAATSEKSMLTVNDTSYTLAGNAGNVSIKGNVINGLETGGSLEISRAGFYVVNDTGLTVNVGDRIIGTAENSAYIYDSSNIPLDVNTMNTEEIASQAGVSNNYTTVETNTMKTTALLESGSTSDLNGSMALALDNSNSNIGQTANFSNTTGKKKVSLEGGEQNVAFNNEGNNVAVIGSNAIGEKNVSLGSGGDLAIVENTEAPVNITANNGADSIVTAGQNVNVNLNGGATKVIPNAGNVTMKNYDAATGAGIQANAYADISRAILNGYISFGNGSISLGSAVVNFADEDADSYSVNFFNNKGSKQKVGYTNSNGGTLDVSGERENMLLVGNKDGNKGASTFTAGSGDDVAVGGSGDNFDLGAGNNSIFLDENRSNSSGATINQTANSGRTEVSGFKTGYGETADRVNIDISAQVSYKNGKLTFNYLNATLTINLSSSSADLAESADLIADDNFIGNTTLDDITPITYEQGDYQLPSTLDKWSENSGQWSLASAQG